MPGKSRVCDELMSDKIPPGRECEWKPAEVAGIEGPLWVVPE